MLNNALTSEISKLKEDLANPPPPRMSILQSVEDAKKFREEVRTLRTDLATKSQEVIQLQAQLIESKQRWADYTNLLQTALQEVENEAMKVKIANAEMRTRLEEIEEQRKAAVKPKKTSFLDRIKKH